MKQKKHYIGLLNVCIYFLISFHLAFFKYFFDHNKFLMTHKHTSLA